MAAVSLIVFVTVDFSITVLTEFTLNSLTLVNILT